MKAIKKDLGKSQIEIEFELDEQEFAKYIDKALEHLKGHVKMDGFRPGTVPKDIVEKKVGNENLLMEAGDLAVKETYIKFVTENNLEPIGEPEVQIKKIAKGNPMQFTVKVSVLPEVELPNYKEIASQIKGAEVVVEEKEIEEALHYLQRSRAKFTDKAGGAEKKDYVKIEYQNEHINGGKTIGDIFILGEAGFLPDFEDNLLGMKAGEEKEFTAKFPENTPNNLGGKEGKFKVKMILVQTMDLPEVNDEFAKSLGMFDNLMKLKENMHEGITLEKKENEKQRVRGEMLEKVTAQTKLDIPEKMAQYEQERLFEDLKHHIAHNFKISFEEYLKSIKKSEQEIKDSFKLEAEKKIKNFLVLRAIGNAEKIEVSNEELEESMNKELRKHTKGQAEQIDINQLKEYTKGAIFNEKVFQKLESFSQ